VVSYLEQNFSVVSTGGREEGRCQRIIWNESTENGLVINARVDQIRHASCCPPRVVWGDGYCNCGVSGPIYRIVDAQENIPTQSGNMTWNDIQLNIPSDVSSFSLKLTLFTGETRIITNSDVTKLFEVIKSNNILVIRPKEPNDL
jgi:hypothetical protein